MDISLLCSKQSNKILEIRLKSYLTIVREGALATLEVDAQQSISTSH